MSTAAASWQEAENWSRSQQKSRSGQYQTPQQQEMLDYLLPTLQDRLSTNDPGRPFSEYLGQVGGQVGQYPALNRPDFPTAADDRSMYYNKLGGLQQEAAGWLAAGNRRTPYATPEAQQFAGAQAGALARQNLYDWWTPYSIGSAKERGQLDMQFQSMEQQQRAAMSQEDITRRQLGLAAVGQDIERENALLNALNIKTQPLSYSATDAMQQAYGYSRGGSAYGQTD